MTSALNLEIAGISISICGADESIDVNPPTDRAYQAFIIAKAPPQPAILVTVYPHPANKLDQLEKVRLFDGGGVWSLFSTESGYLLTHNPFEKRPPLWSFATDKEFTKIDAYCHPSIGTPHGKRLSIPCPVTYPLDQIILLHHLALKGGLIVHSTGLAHADQGVLMAGRSGAGKSSVARLLAPGRTYSVISDDRMVVKKVNGGYHAFGTPWPGEAKIALNRSFPLGPIFFLTQAATNRARRLSQADALKRLLPVASIPWYDDQVLPQVLDFCGDIVKHTTNFDLQFTLDGRLTETLAGCLEEPGVE